MIADETVMLAVPRSALTVIERPHRVSQRNALAVLGLPPRAFLELAREFRDAGGEVLSVGKLRCVALEAFDAWLCRRNAKPSPARAANDVDALEAEIGVGAVVGGKR